ncbi:MAG: hypothetical protein AAFZ52_17830, partial [Bacteroidota bacterium]
MFSRSALLCLCLFGVGLSAQAPVADYSVQLQRANSLREAHPDSAQAIYTNLAKRALMAGDTLPAITTLLASSKAHGHLAQYKD